MANFARPSSWLRQLFTPSHTSQPNPDRVSDDVSLNQPYDGGGFPLWDEGQWASFVDSGVFSASDTNLLTVPENQICRILAVSAELRAGVAPNAYVKVAGASQVVISQWASPIPPVVQRICIPLFTPIIGPTHTLIGSHHGGDAATVVRWAFYYVLAPLGTVFYV